MVSTVRNIVIDCADPFELATFWSAVVGRPLLDDDLPGDPEAVILMADGPALFFAHVAERKVGKNRLHLCVTPDGHTADELDRLRALGAEVIVDRRRPDGGGWVVMADPEGNEFCILRGTLDPEARQGGEHT